jgi:hypothetical protein
MYLESMSALLRKKSLRDKVAKKKAAKKKQEESVEKRTKQKKKAAFVPDPDNAGEEKDKEEVAVKEVAMCFKCVAGFAVHVDRRNNAKWGFDKKITEGLSFLHKYLDKAACILPSGKDQGLNPIKTKADLLKYQVTMKNYFIIPNPMVFSNMTQEGGRVIKGSAVMGFLLDPKECLDDAAGDLRMMGCSLFYKKCQEVDTVLKSILLGVSNSIKEDVIKGIVDKVLADLECTLLRTDSDYKLTKDQQENWIKYTVIKEFPPWMPWEDAEGGKKQGSNNTQLAYILQVY